MPPTTETLSQAVSDMVAMLHVSLEGLGDRADAVAAAADEAGDRQSADLARLMHADLAQRAGQVSEGLASARHILDASGDRVVRAHAHAVIARILWRAGDSPTAVRHALRGHRMLELGDPIALRADHANVLALHVNDRRLGGMAHQEFETAQDLAEESGYPSLINANLNNWAWCSYVAGDLATAGRLADRMYAYATESGEPLNSSCADTVARIWLETGRNAEAAQVITYAIETAAITDSDAITAGLMTLAEIQSRSGDLQDALVTLRRCQEMAVAENLADEKALVLRMIAECYAGLEDYRAAYQAMVEFHQAWTERRSQESDVAAQVAHAQFAVDEAYRDSARLRELAERDPLTGLWNRRRCDAELAAALASGRPTCVALLDLDHFKRINDGWSHAVGDEVLRRVAAILTAAGGHAGRQGGEEFLLILPGELGDAVLACEAVRREIEAYDWESVGPGLTVTTSAGITPLLAADDAGLAVSRADGLLYEAKHAGRNRVVAG